jgi:hypothetical protein
MLKAATKLNWTVIMYDTMSTFHPASWIYYVLIIFIVGVFGFNMIIAVLKVHYNQSIEEQIPKLVFKVNTLPQLNIYPLRKYGSLSSYMQGLYRIFQDMQSKTVDKMRTRGSLMTLYRHDSMVEPVRKALSSKSSTARVLSRTDWQKDLSKINF